MIMISYIDIPGYQDVAPDVDASCGTHMEIQVDRRPITNGDGVFIPCTDGLDPSAFPNLHVPADSNSPRIGEEIG
jgi:hypothetical protein